MLSEAQQLVGHRQRHPSDGIALAGVVESTMCHFERSAAIDQEIVQGSKDRCPNLTVRHARNTADQFVIGAKVLKPECADQLASFVDLQRAKRHGVTGAGICCATIKVRIRDNQGENGFAGLS